MSQWKECPLKDLLVLHDKKRIPLSSIEREKRKGPYPYYGAASIFGYVDDYLFDGDFILLGEDGTVVTPAGKPVLQLIHGKSWVNNHAHVITASDLVEFRFLYYGLMNLDVRSIVTGAVQPKISQSSLFRLSMSIPDLPVQRRIAGVLGALDDKIENNRKTCANLEAQAQALFKSWFVDFEPFGGKMPKGWKMGKLGEVFDFQRGKTISKKDVCQARDPNHKYVVYGAGQDIFGYSESFLLNQPSVLIAAIGAGAGTVSRSYEKKYSVTSNAFFVMPRDERFYPYAFYFLMQFDFMTFCSGSAQPMLAYNAFANENIIMPDDNHLRRFCDLCWPIVRGIDEMMSENDSLAAVRDALLPRLMSGEIDVSKVEA